MIDPAPFVDPKSHAVGAMLPRFTFIAGPNGSGKTTLGNLLFTQVMGLQLFSFAEPIRDAILGLFHQGDITIDLTQEAWKQMPVPGFPAVTHREALNALGDWFRSFFGPSAIGEYARYRVEANADYFSQFVFDDARRMADIQPILNTFGPQHCLVVRLSRPGVSFDQPHHFTHDVLSGCRAIDLSNDGPIDHLLRKLQTAVAMDE